MFLTKTMATQGLNEIGALKSHRLTSQDLSTCWRLCVGVYKENRFGFEVVVL